MPFERERERETLLGNIVHKVTVDKRITLSFNARIKQESRGEGGGGIHRIATR